MILYVTLARMLRHLSRQVYFRNGFPQKTTRKGYGHGRFVLPLLVSGKKAEEMKLVGS